MSYLNTGGLAALALIASWTVAGHAMQQSPAAPAAAPPPAAAAAPQGRGGPQGPVVVSPEVQADRRVIFRLLAPQATDVSLRGTDIPNNMRGLPMTKGDEGVWSVTVGPLDAGAYRYNFNIGGVSVIDPRNPSTSESNTNTWSLVVVPGSDEFDTKQVPHGAVASITYYSSSLGRFRRMHVYTPPSYEIGQQKYPVFYLLHGAGDSDDSWSSVGRSGFILDNLIATKRAKPMVVVMPAGHTSRTMGRGAGPNARDEFNEDFVGDVMPYVEKNYRVLTDRGHRAIAGLSMGGAQTLTAFVGHMDKFAYVGVFSSGVFGIVPPTGRAGAPAPPPPPPGPSWEEQHLAALDNASAKKGLRVFWFSTGSEDGLMPTTKATVEMFKKHGFDAVFKESPGGHTWLNWRNYLVEFTPQLFQEGSAPAKTTASR